MQEGNWKDIEKVFQQYIKNLQILKIIFKYLKIFM